MKLEDIDLYDYFRVEKPKDDTKGILHCYYLDNDPETGMSRIHPTILIIPGGGYGFVSYREGEPIATKFLSYGFHAAVLEYTVAPNAHYPQILNEAIMANVYLHRTIEKHHGAKDNIAGIGFSAGGHLLGLLNTTTDQEISSLGFKRREVTLNGSVYSYPVVSSNKEIMHSGSFENLTNHNEELAKELAIENRPIENASPSYIWTTKDDDLVSYKNSELLRDILTTANIDNELHIFEHGCHGLSTNDINVYHEDVLKKLPVNSSWIKEAVHFLNQHNIKIKD